MAECKIEECPKPTKARGWCSSHLERWRRYGDPLFVTPRQAETNRRLSADFLSCSACGEVRPVGDFYADNSRPCGRKSYCKSCARAYGDKWIAENAERIDAWRKSWRAGWTEERRSEANAANAEWKRKNPEKVRDYNHRRRALKASTGRGEIDYDALWEACGGICPDCNGTISRAAPWPSSEFASLDHIIPLSKGGGHTQENLRYCCLPCNLTKSAKIPA